MTQEEKQGMGIIFKILYAKDVNDKVEKKGNLTYLSWSYAWAEVKKVVPDANYKVYENADGWNYFHDGRTAWVKCSVTINGLEHIEYLPIMDARNQSIPLEKVTSTAVNKTIQRCITKACARHGLGLYVYAGEDLPEAPKKDTAKEDETISFGTASRAVKEPTPDVALPFDIGGPIETEALELNALKALMDKDSISEQQVLDAFKGKYSSIDNIEPHVIQEMLLDKWASFKKFVNKEK